MPGLDTPAAFARTGAVPITDLARSYDKHQPIVLINARTLRRQLIWAELDSNATSPENTALLIHPAKNLREGERYIVALRKLRGADGRLLKASPAFRRYRDRIKTESKPFERRRAHMEDIFRRLKHAHIKRHQLYLRLGLHGGERAQPVPAPAPHPRRRLRATSATPTWAT